MNENAQPLRGVMIQVAGGKLLMPNAVIAEILSVVDPEPMPGAPDWVLGQVRWRGWQVPLVSYTRLAGLGASDELLRGQRVLVLKALGAHARLPYFALLTQGFPRLVSVGADSLETVEDWTEGDGVVAARVRYQDEAVIVPDLDGIGTRLQEALAA